MKRIVSLILSAAILLSFILSTLSVQASELVRIGTSDTYYIYDEENGVLTITGSGDMTNFSNQSNVPWKDFRGSIKHIVVEEGITSIGNYSFYSFTACADASLPSTLTSIGKNAFARSSVEEVNLPPLLTLIDNYAFYMTSVRSVKIPQGVTSIGKYAFMQCEALERFELSFGINCTINSYALSGCLSLDKLIVPSTVSLGARSFGYNVNNTALVRDDLTVYGYMETSAQTYAASNNIDFVNLEECAVPIYEGSTLEAEIYKNGSFAVFEFTPEVTAEYNFYSSGSVDTEGYLYDENGVQIAYSDDISATNRNFRISHILEAGHTYSITIRGYKENASGAFCFTAEHEHIYSCEVVEPDLSNGGYTVYSCEWCGITFTSDYTERLGGDVSGKINLIDSADGSSVGRIPVANAEIYVDGEYKATTGENGEYGVLLKKGVHMLTVCPPYGKAVSLEITVADDMAGTDIAVHGFDFNHDGVINYRDYSALVIYAQKGIITDADYNGDGIVDGLDFFAANDLLNTAL